MTTPDMRLGIHPAADIFPMLPDNEMTELAKSISVFGLREKITLIANRQPGGPSFLVIDGRNRLEALRKMGVSDVDIVNKYSRAIELKNINATPEEYVMMANIERRNLTRAQRKALAGKLALMIAEAQKDKPKEEQVDSTAVAAQKAGVSRRTAATAKQTEVAKLSGTGGAATKKKPTAKKKPVGVSVVKMVERVLDVKKHVQGSGHNWPEAQLVALRDACEGIVANVTATLAKIEADKIVEAEKVLAAAKKKEGEQAAS